MIISVCNVRLRGGLRFSFTLFFTIKIEHATRCRRRPRSRDRENDSNKEKPWKNCTLVFVCTIWITLRNEKLHSLNSSVSNGFEHKISQFSLRIADKQRLTTSLCGHEKCKKKNDRLKWFLWTLISLNWHDRIFFAAL